MSTDTTAPSTSRTLALATSRAASMSHDERQRLTRQLLAEAHTAPSTAVRDDLLAAVIELNHRVALAVARRYANRGVALEDLQQAASEGLVKAVLRYDDTREQDLLSYAVPTIRGEVLRHFRDHSWSVRPPRRVQELQQLLRRTRDDLYAADGLEPTDLAVREAAGVSEADQTEAATASGCFQPTSLDQPTEPGSGISLGDLIPLDADQLGAAEARAMLSRLLPTLGSREQRVIYLRFFEERTQGEIGREFGVTQATVSRWLRETLDALRLRLEPVAA